MIKIEINKNNLVKVTKIILNNLKEDIKNIKDKDEKLALYYLKINGKDYYYSYNLLKDAPEEVKDSYRLVNINKAKMLLENQIK